MSNVLLYALRVAIVFAQNIKKVHCTANVFQVLSFSHIKLLKCTYIQITTNNKEHNLKKVLLLYFISRNRML